MKCRRILYVGLFHETNTFAPGETEFLVTRGDQLLKKTGDASPTGRFLAVANGFGWETIPLLDGRAKPGPAVSRLEVEDFLAEVEEQVAAQKNADAIFAVLHGAMTVEGLPDVEGELLRKLAASSDGLPVFGVLDLHANFTSAMAKYSQGLIAYRENPHTDAAETAERATRLMAESLDRGLSLRTQFVATPIVWPPSGTDTAAAPMQALEALARQEEHSGMVAVNVLAGFAHADVPDAGLAFSLVYDPARVSSERLEGVAERLRAAAWRDRHLALAKEWNLDEAINDALEKKVFPVCLVEPSDNIGGGGTGDGTAILRALLRREISGGGVILCDPEAVRQLSDKAPGGTYTVEVGGKLHPNDEGPVSLTAKLIRITDGNFTLEDRQSPSAVGGGKMAMGPSAVLESRGITVLVTSRRTSPNDLGQWRSQGVEPAQLTFIGIKAAVAYRRAYDPICRAHYTVNLPGPCTSNLRSLPYHHIRRPIFPLDEAVL